MEKKEKLTDIISDENLVEVIVKRFKVLQKILVI